MAGWRVDVVGAQGVVQQTAHAGQQLQSAASAVGVALDSLQRALATTKSSAAAGAFARARQGDPPAVVHRVADAITAAANAMTEIMAGDTEMSSRTVAAARTAGAHD